MDLSSPLIIFFAFALYGVLHSFLASTAAKDWARRQLGNTTVDKGYRLFFNVVGVLALLPILYLVVRLPDRPLYSAPGVLRPFMLAGQIVAVFILAAALNKTDALDFAGLRQLSGDAKSSSLVTDGVYRWVRHPLYTGSMLFLWLIPEVPLNYFVLNMSITIYFIIGAMFEERKLERYFGEEYRNYKARTGMFVPFFKISNP